MSASESSACNNYGSDNIMPASTVKCHSLVFFVNGNKIIDHSPDPSWTLLMYLRRNLLLTGTKLGCGEGGCGACTVMVSKFDRHFKKITHYSVNACLAPICSMHGLAVTTVEGIGSSKTRLHPVQERIALAHGSQCGFCTPGIVMSMYTLLRNRTQPSEEDIEVAMQGNLCRCTGYRPILQGLSTFTKKGCCGNPENCCMNGRTNGEADGTDTVDCIGTALFDPAKFAEYDPTQELTFPPELQLTDVHDSESLQFSGKYTTWYRPVCLDELLHLKRQYPEAKIIVGNTEIGVEVKFRNREYPHLICATHVKELTSISISEDGIQFGAGVTLSNIERTIHEEMAKQPAVKMENFRAILEMLNLFASQQIRNVAAIGGNIMTASPISDMIPLLVAAGATLRLVNTDGQIRCCPVDKQFFIGYRQVAVKSNEILFTVTVPFTEKWTFTRGYKQSHRRDDDIAIVNAGMCVHFHSINGLVSGSDVPALPLVVHRLDLCFGGVAPTPRAVHLSSKFTGRLWDNSLLTEVTSVLEAEITVPPGSPGGSEKYRQCLVLSFFYRFFLDVVNTLSELQPLYPTQIDQRELSGVSSIPRGPLSASQMYELVPRDQPEHDPIGRPVPHASTFKQVSGEATYVDDMPRRSGELYLAPVYSSRARATLVKVDWTEAVASDPAVAGYIDVKDVQGDNCFRICETLDEFAFAEKEVTCVGQVIGAILADSQEVAQRAARKVRVTYGDPVRPPIITIEDAIKEESFYEKRTRLVQGDVEAALKAAPHVIRDEVWLGGQEHFYLETHGLLVEPRDAGNELEVHASVQNPAAMQAALSTVTGLPMHKVAIRVKRLGGGFGGKETRGCVVAAPAAVAALKWGRPVRCMLDRDEDMAITGTRHPCLARYEVAVGTDGQIQALRAKLYYNSGNTVDLSIGVALCGVLKIFNCYRIPVCDIEAILCRTNLPSNTAFRGFGYPQTMFTIETIMTRIGEELGIDQRTIREQNFVYTGYEMPYEYKLPNVTMGQCWEECLAISKYDEGLIETEQFNRQNRWKKRGIFLTPLLYGCSFIERFLNRASALVHIYLDGSVLVTHGGVEMGQGLHTKMIQVASRELGVPIKRVHIAEMATDKIPNATSTAASFSSDLNGMAVIAACTQLNAALTPIKKKYPEASWEELINKALLEGVALSAEGHYYWTDEPYDLTKHRGKPLAYYTYGAACAQVEIDCLTGDHVVRQVDIVMDLGASLNPAIDIGQIEGGFMQGYGLLTIEEGRVSPDGVLLTRGPGAYKIPGFSDIPRVLRVHLLRGSRCEHTQAVYSSKAVGEPPLLLAHSVFFAIREAIQAARVESGLRGYFRLDGPATAERIRLACHDSITKSIPEPTIGSYKQWDVRL